MEWSSAPITLGTPLSPSEDPQPAGDSVLGCNLSVLRLCPYGVGDTVRGVVWYSRAEEVTLSPLPKVGLMRESPFVTLLTK